MNQDLGYSFPRPVYVVNGHGGNDLKGYSSTNYHLYTRVKHP